MYLQVNVSNKCNIHSKRVRSLILLSVVDDSDTDCVFAAASMYHRSGDVLMETSL